MRFIALVFITFGILMGTFLAGYKSAPPILEQTYPFEERYYEQLSKRQRAEYDLRQLQIELTRWQSGLIIYEEGG